MVILSDHPYRVPRELLKNLKVESMILQGKPYTGQKSSWITLVLRGFLSKKHV